MVLNFVGLHFCSQQLCPPGPNNRRGVLMLIALSSFLPARISKLVLLKETIECRCERGCTFFANESGLLVQDNLLQRSATKAHRGHPVSHRLDHAATERLMKPAGRAGVNVNISKLHKPRGVFAKTPESDAIPKPSQRNLTIKFAPEIIPTSPNQVEQNIRILHSH